MTAPPTTTKHRLTDDCKLSGVGVGLRPAFAQELFERRPDSIRWVELHPENYIGRGGASEQRLGEAIDTFPISAHGLTLCFGNVDAPQEAYLASLREFLGRVGAPWYSDHLCFCRYGNAHSHDLLPLPRTAATIDHCVARIQSLQHALGVPIAIENVSAYVDDPEWTYSEHDFVRTIAEEADCRLLLDVNNVYVNARNHGFDARDYIRSIPPERVCQLHVAGHLLRPDGMRIDTHGEAIIDDVYDLLRFTLEHLGPTPILLERDGNFPPFDELLREVETLETIRTDVLG